MAVFSSHVHTSAVSSEGPGTYQEHVFPCFSVKFRELKELMKVSGKSVMEPRCENGSVWLITIALFCDHVCY